MKFSELSGKSIAELYQRLAEIKKAEFDGRIKLKTGEGIKSHVMRGYRRDVAKIFTKINQIKLGGN